MTDEMMAIIDDLAVSLILGILGIAITVFTVIYSFMESTKERKRSLSDTIRNAVATDPVAESDLQFAINRLISLKRMNCIVISIIILDLVDFAVYSFHLFFKDVCWIEITLLILTALLLMLCVIALVLYLVQYYKRFKEGR